MREINVGDHVRMTSAARRQFGRNSGHGVVLARGKSLVNETLIQVRQESGRGGAGWWAESFWEIDPDAPPFAEGERAPMHNAPEFLRDLGHRLYLAIHQWRGVEDDKGRMVVGDDDAMRLHDAAAHIAELHADRLALARCAAGIDEGDARKASLTLAGRVLYETDFPGWGIHESQPSNRVMFYKGEERR